MEKNKNLSDYRKFTVIYKTDDGTEIEFCHRKRGYYSSVNAARKGISNYRALYHYKRVFGENGTDGLPNPETYRIVGIE